MDIDINSLLRLAREPSSEKRRELLRSVTDMFMANLAEQTAAVNELFGDVLTRVVDKVDLEARAELCERIAPARETPHELARRLAHDESIRVAAPMISQSPVLTDEDLLEIAETKSDDHLLAISRRETIAAEITDVLIRRGSEVVQRGVTSNAGAALTNGCLRFLLDMAMQDRDIRRNLFARSDLPPKFREIISDIVRFGDPSLETTDELAALVGRVAADFARASGLQPAQVRVMIDGEKLEPLIIIGRALNLSEDAFEKVLRYRMRRPGRPIGEVSEGIDRFKTLPEEAAKRVVHFIKLRAKSERAA
ncbi:MAG: DUF2336 domain-containing protein [Flavobacteriaceae bacterium]